MIGANGSVRAVVLIPSWEQPLVGNLSDELGYGKHYGNQALMEKFTDHLYCHLYPDIVVIRAARRTVGIEKKCRGARMK